jgi:hypothetical protein
MILLLGGGSFLWASLNNLQTLGYTQYLNLRSPPNFKSFMSVFHEFNLNLLPSPFIYLPGWINKLFRVRIPGFHKGILAPGKLGEEQIYTGFIINAGSQVATVLLSIMALSSLFIGTKVRFSSRSLASYIPRAYREGKYNMVIRAYDTVLLPVVFFAFLQVSDVSLQSMPRFMNFLIGGFVVGSVLTVLGVYSVKLMSRRTSINPAFASLYYHLPPQNPVQTYYILISYTKRLILASTVSLLQSFPMIQVAIWVMVSLSAIGITWLKRPYQDWFLDAKSCILDSITMSVSLLQFNMNREPHISLTLGWIAIGICCLALALELVPLLILQLKGVKSLLNFIKQYLPGHSTSEPQASLQKQNTPVRHANRLTQPD